MKRGDETRQRILDESLKLARRGLHLVTARNVGMRLGLTHSAVLYHFGTIEDMRNAVATYAVECGDGAVIDRLRLDDHPAIRAPVRR